MGYNANININEFIKKVKRNEKYNKYEYFSPNNVKWAMSSMKEYISRALYDGYLETDEFTLVAEIPSRIGRRHGKFIVPEGQTEDGLLKDLIDDIDELSKSTVIKYNKAYKDEAISFSSQCDSFYNRTGVDGNITEAIATVKFFIEIDED